MKPFLPIYLKIENSRVSVNKLIILCENDIKFTFSTIKATDIYRNGKDYPSSLVIKCKSFSYYNSVIYMKLLDMDRNWDIEGPCEEERGAVYFEGLVEELSLM